LFFLSPRNPTRPYEFLEIEQLFNANVYTHLTCMHVRVDNETARYCDSARAPNDDLRRRFCSVAVIVRGAATELMTSMSRVCIASNNGLTAAIKQTPLSHTAICSCQPAESCCNQKLVRHENASGENAMFRIVSVLQNTRQVAS
jgi:hypothetical protein